MCSDIANWHDLKWKSCKVWQRKETGFEYEARERKKEGTLVRISWIRAHCEQITVIVCLPCSFQFPFCIPFNTIQHTLFKIGRKIEREKEKSEKSSHPKNGREKTNLVDRFRCLSRIPVHSFVNSPFICCLANSTFLSHSVNPDATAIVILAIFNRRPKGDWEWMLRFLVKWESLNGRIQEDANETKVVGFSYVLRTSIDMYDGNLVFYQSHVWTRFFCIPQLGNMENAYLQWLEMGILENASLRITAVLIRESRRMFVNECMTKILNQWKKRWL